MLCRSTFPSTRTCGAGTTSRRQATAATIGNCALLATGARLRVCARACSHRASVIVTSFGQEALVRRLRGAAVAAARCRGPARALRVGVFAQVGSNAGAVLGSTRGRRLLRARSAHEHCWSLCASGALLARACGEGGGQQRRAERAREMSRTAQASATSAATERRRLPPGAGARDRARPPRADGRPSSGADVVPPAPAAMGALRPRLVYARAARTRRGPQPSARARQGVPTLRCTLRPPPPRPPLRHGRRPLALV